MKETAMHQVTGPRKRPKASRLTNPHAGPRLTARAVCTRAWRLGVVSAAACAVLLTLLTVPAGAATPDPHPLLNPTFLSLNPHVYGRPGYGVNLDPVTTISRYYGPRFAAERCRLHIGAQATTNREAVGSIEIYCFSGQYIEVDLRLHQKEERNSWVRRSANHTNVWKYVPARTWMVWDTDPGVCGSGYWRVDAQIAVYGHGGNSYFGPTGKQSWFASQTKSFAAC